MHGPGTEPQVLLHCTLISSSIIFLTNWQSDERSPSFLAALGPFPLLTVLAHLNAFGFCLSPPQSGAYLTLILTPAKEMQ